MICLTNDLSKYAFDINLEAQNKNDRFKRNRSKSCVAEVTVNNVPMSYIGENDNNKKQYNSSNTIASPIKINNKVIYLYYYSIYLILLLNIYVE